MGCSYSCTYPYVTSHNTSGCFAAIRRSVLAAPEGVLLPCSQSRRVRAEMPRSAANFSWDRPVFARASATSMRPAGMISSFSTVPSLRVTSRRNEPSGCGIKRVFRAHWIRPPLSIISMKRRTASLALLTVEHLLDLFEPCAGHIVALSLSIGGDQNNLPLCNPEKINYPGAAAFPFPFGGPSQLAATAQ